jgi:polar amino acid transport system substrate-binding protein
VRVCRYSFLLWLLTTACAHATPLEVAADEWCPFNCQPDAPMPGYVIELLKNIFPQGITYRVVPWKRAVLQTQKGISAAAVGATAAMAAAEHLQIGREPVAFTSDCLYVAAGNPLRYQGKADDLNPLKRVGIVLGYEYHDGFGEWLARAANKAKVYIASGHQPAEANLRKLAAGSLSGMIEAGVVMDYLLHRAGLSQAVVRAGCDTPVPIYVAFGPKSPAADALVVTFDQGMAALRKSGKLASILAKYGLTDWQ